MTASKHKIALIQMYSKPLDPETNFATASSQIRAAVVAAATSSASGAANEGLQRCKGEDDSESEGEGQEERQRPGLSLAVLPEYHLTSWVPDDSRFAAVCKETMKGGGGRFLERYRELAMECRVCIVPGTMVEVEREEEGEKLVNVAYFIGWDGEVLGRYVKTNLWHPERPHLSPAPSHHLHTPFPTPLGQVGLLICWDLAFPEAFRELIGQGAQLIVVPAFWMATDCSARALEELNPDAERLFVESVLVARAFENTCAVIFVNTGGPPDSGFLGLSQVTVPFIGALPGKIETAEPKTSIVELDMEVLEEAERVYRVREDLGAEGWRYVYRHSLDAG